jgi:hemoglobin
MPALPAAIFEAMGRDNIFAMLNDFYQELGRSPIRSMFAEDLDAASRKSAAFYVQLLGGPRLFDEQYGNPMMRQRHMRFRIDEAARTIWIGCFMRTLEDATRKYAFPAEHLDAFRGWLGGFSRWMVNTAPGDGV